MTFEFKPRKPLPVEIRRLMSEQLDRIEEHLQAKADPDERVHDARKRIKETRALLRLLRPHLGRRFPIENRWYRAAAHDLSAARDAAALIEALHILRKRGPDRPTRRAISSIHATLRTKTGSSDLLEARLANLLAQLPYARARLDTWPEFEDRFSTIGDGIERTFRSGRNALRTVERDHTPEHFHEFRKRVKDHWYQSQLLRRVWPDLMKPYTDVVSDLADVLGHHHDLIVLRQTLMETPESFGGEKTLHLGFAAIESWRDELERRTIEMAAPIYSEKPSRWRRRIRGYWKLVAPR